MLGMVTAGRTSYTRQDLSFLQTQTLFSSIQEEEGKVLAFYTKGDEVVAVLTLGRDPLAAR